MKKKIFIFTVALLAIVALLHVALFFVINAKGKDLIVLAIKKNLGVDAQVGAVSIALPFGVEIKDFKCGDVSFQHANFYLGLFNPLKPRLTFRKVYLGGLVAIIKKESNKISASPFIFKSSLQKEGPPLDTSKLDKSVGTKKVFSFRIKKLFIRNATIDFIDFTRSTPFRISLKDINLDLYNVIYPEFPKSFLKFNASLEKQGNKIKDIVMMSGWIDYLNKNMDVKIAVNNYNYFMFGEYYPRFWKPDNLGIQEALLSLSSSWHATNNDLVIESVLSLNKIEFLEEAKDSSKTKFLKSIFATFSANSDVPQLPIRLHTTMDQCQLDFSEVYAMAKSKVKISPDIMVERVVDKSKVIVKEGVKDVKGLTIDNAVGAVKGVVGAVKDLVTHENDKKSKDDLSSNCSDTVSPQQ